MTVSLNGKIIPINSFRDFVEQKYTDSQDIVFTQFKDNNHNLPWEVAVGVKNQDHVSFVNGINTTYGGSHVSLLVDKITDALQDALFGKHRSAAQRLVIKDNFTLFLKCQISNPEFNSQTKGRMTYPRAGDIQVELPKKFIQELCGDNTITASILEAWKSRMSKNDKKLARERAKRLTIRKLEDAKYAGTTHGRQCSLILTEGDSAKSLAVSGLSEVNRDFWGVLPLRGKLLNVSKSTTAKFEKNDVFINLAKALGLDTTKTYETEAERRTLRYGSVVIMCDQDSDGNHIKGLVINYFKTYWPSLLRGWDFNRRSYLSNTSEGLRIQKGLAKEGCPEVETSFLKQLITPVIKVFPKRNANNLKEKWFFSQDEYDAWEAKLSKDQLNTDYKVKYYKGLGTSTSEEGKQYFSSLYRKDSPLLVSFKSMSPVDEDAIELAFGDNVIARRKWLEGESLPDPNTTSTELPTPLDASQLDSSTYHGLMYGGVYSYFQCSNKRALPDSIDGLKPSQRKILHTCFASRSLKEVKVTQLGGLVLESTAYHHGETSLFETIVKMGQNFTGSGNNIPLLDGVGQFGTRLAGGNDFAGPRYISVALSPLARYIFPEADDCNLPPNYDEGQQIEPERYIPIIPMCLVNGGTGIGSGFSTKIPSYDPLVLMSVIYNLVSIPGHFEHMVEVHEKRKQLLSEYRACVTEHTNKITTRMESIDIEAIRAQVIAAEKAAPVKKTATTKKKTKKLSLEARITKKVNSLRSKLSSEIGTTTRKMKKLQNQIDALKINLIPWYDHHKQPDCVNNISRGISEINGRFQHVTELPISEWTETFKVKLDSLLDRKLIRGYSNESSEKEVDFTIEHSGLPKQSNLAKQAIQRILAKPLQELLRLTTAEGVREMTVEEIIFEEFIHLRLDLYKQRIARSEESREYQIRQREKMLAISKIVTLYNPFTEAGLKDIRSELKK
eukprot:TRINITY_DN12369_c2_g1_i1.p1 TRINITY_DN12369_c2_g1~~TRINITY_DN12369_c2_g1_i1.p1  ORF type:complete len:954 (+),score=140.94 TRINITY_DN12369_c2_g1_i1:792-3653(+)